MAGTPGGRVLFDKPGERPHHSRIVDIPDVLIYMEKEHDNFHLVPSHLTRDPKESGKTRHQQGIDIIKKTHETFIDAMEKKEHKNEYRKDVYRIEAVDDCSAAGPVRNKEPQTQSCTVNNPEQSSEHDGQMEDSTREKFIEVFDRMAKHGQDVYLKEIIEKKIPQSLFVTDDNLLKLLPVLVHVHHGDNDFTNFQHVGPMALNRRGKSGPRME